MTPGLARRSRPFVRLTGADDCPKLPSMTSLGLELKKQRESRNISIDEMASSTKIVGRYLEALEQDRFDVMPGGFFIKGIIRTYAKYVGLDEAEVLAKYRESGALEEPAKPRPPEARTLTARSLPVLAGKNKFLVWLVAAAGILLFLVALTFLWRSRRPRPAQTVPPVAKVLPQTQTAQPREEPKQEPAPAPPVKEAAAKAAAIEEWKGLTLDMSFQEETWIQVYVDGTLKVSGLFPAGEKARAIAEKEILIGVLGNAGGLTFLLNGKPGKTLGQSGEVLNNIRITLDNQKEYLREPTAPSN
jgi:cytoskeleton protein RodZ